MAERVLAGDHHGLAQRRMRMNGERHVVGEGTHLDGERGLADHVGGPRADDVHAQDLMRPAVGHGLHEAVGLAHRHGTTARRERHLAHLHVDTAGARLVLGEVNGAPAQGYSTGQAIAAVNEVAAKELPAGAKFEWSELMFQQILAGNTALFVFPLCVLLVFLVLAAQYESWSLPLSVILIVPMCLLAAIAGVWLTNGDNNLFTQIGRFVLVGLACKNAILIVEVAKEQQENENIDAVSAVLAACRLRLRRILMTSIAFIMGVWPLVSARGAGAEMRHAMGVAVFSGMIGVTVFGLLFTPVFFTILRRRARSRARLGGRERGGGQASVPVSP